jgi:hypothetical protein
MMLGIQSLMFENKKELFWDFSQLSLDQIEDIVGKYCFILKIEPNIII